MDPLALKVAARFAAKPMKPEKLKELMLKLRKGAGSSLFMKALLPVFEALKGWEFEETLVLRPENSYHPNNVGDFHHAHRDVVEDAWREAKKKEVSTLPSNASLSSSDLNSRVFMNARAPWLG